MNHHAMLAVAACYARLLENEGAIAQRADLARRFGLDRDDHVERPTLLNHARWQLEMVGRVLHRLGGEATAIRLLGSAQGILLASGLLTVGDVWRDNATWLDGTSVRAFDAAMAEMDSAPSGMGR